MTDDTLTRTKESTMRWARKLFMLASLLFAACGGVAGHGPPPPPPTCSHSPCHTGAALNYACDSCVGSICGTASNPCCNLDAGAGVDAGWSASCVAMVNTYCNQNCDCSQTGTTGRAYNHYACNCTLTECSSSVNPSCCSSTWSQGCVNDVKALGYDAGCNPTP